MEIQIRPEVPGDIPGIRAVNEAAFGGTIEADLVDDLRQDGDVVLSLVAVVDGRVAGHLLLSRVWVNHETESQAALSLAPIAVLPELQRRGIGHQLVNHGLGTCRELSESLVVVLGHPEYYARFGFHSDLAKELISPFGGGEAWMALKLNDSKAGVPAGRVVYAKAFLKLLQAPE